MRYEERLWGLRCSACGEEDALVLDVSAGVVECRACQARAWTDGLADHDHDHDSDGEDFGGESGDGFDGERGVA
ncbi:hypothetical protein ACIA8R_05105 [Nonomuraea sp. NPDC051191]|uniref:hypothetical protein n=1 Tax=Nonomuraea sp. NPDC051191 TaxID=3364372 RepID=UPI0037B3B4D8